jgi:hypothetical protein
MIASKKEQKAAVALAVPQQSRRTEKAKKGDDKGENCTLTNL